MRRAPGGLGRLDGNAGLLRRVERFLPFVAAAVLIAGILVFALNRGGGSHAAARPVPVDPKAVAVARAFIQDGVRRQDLAAAYALTAPELRAGYSLARWKTGNIPVVPYPGKNVEVAPFAVKVSRPGRAVLVVELKAPGSAPTAFRIGLVERGGRWLVSAWGPSQALKPGS